VPYIILCMTKKVLWVLELQRALEAYFVILSFKKYICTFMITRT